MASKKQTGSVKKTVEGGWIARDATTGELRSVGTPKGVSRATAGSELSIREVSSRRSAALKRLADR